MTLKNGKKDFVEDSFFSPKSQPTTPSFSKTVIGTEEKKQEVKLDEGADLSDDSLKSEDQLRVELFELKKVLSLNKEYC